MDDSTSSISLYEHRRPGLHRHPGRISKQHHNIVYACYDNDGATFDIGMTALSAAAAYNEQPGLGERRKKNIVEIMAAHDIPFAATASTGYPDDLVKKVQMARSIQGFKFIHIHTPCPTGWRFQPDDAVNVARLAVKARIHPLYHVLEGQRYIIDLDPEPVPVEAYLETQGNRLLSLDRTEVAAIQEDVDRRWRTLDRCRPASP